MKKTLRNTLRLLRPRQWIKNFLIFAAVTFSGELFDQRIIPKLIFGFLIFCAVSSAIYVINYIFDVEKDRLHPFKRFRPLANNDISLPAAKIIATILAIGALIGSYFINPAFFFITLIYFMLQFSYSMFLKHIEIVDIDRKSTR